MGKLTIQEIATVLVDKNGLKKRDANIFVTQMFDLIQKSLETDPQVKVRGLGTFKIIDVDARESVSVHTGERFVINGHAKVSFIPDATMKELVNKPFSQFETVVLNDGVDFADVNDDPEDDNTDEVEETDTVSATENVSEPELEAEPPKEVEPAVMVGPKKDVEPGKIEEFEKEVVVESDTKEESQPSEEVQLSEEIQPSEETQSSEEVQSSEEIQLFEEPQTAEKVYPDESSEPISFSDSYEETEETDENNSVLYFWILGILGVIVVAVFSAWAGYNYGYRQQVVLVPDTILIRDTIVVAPVDSSEIIKTDSTAGNIVEANKAILMVNATKEKPVAEEPKAKAVQEKTTQKPITKEIKHEAVDRYAQKDERVRLGAYRIVGLEREVKVQAGQTFYSICKGNLGPDMECYVEVYNDLPRNPQIKVGQVIKIPKLQLKKRRK